VIAVGDAGQIREPLEKLGYATVTVSAREAPAPEAGQPETE
jgi:hypothetical protein